MVQCRHITGINENLMGFLSKIFGGGKDDAAQAAAPAPTADAQPAAAPAPEAQAPAPEAAPTAEAAPAEPAQVGYGNEGEDENKVA